MFDHLYNMEVKNNILVTNIKCILFFMYKFKKKKTRSSNFYLDALTFSYLTIILLLIFVKQARSSIEEIPCL